jgi:uncharacterized protein DUF3574
MRGLSAVLTIGLTLLGVLLSGTAVLAQSPPPSQLTCNGAQKAWMVADLLFGRSRVSEANWARFLAAEVTPRFPDGFTVFDARGQWRDPAGQKISRERSKVVTIAMPPGADNDERLQKIIEAYKTRFKQQSVGLIVRPACVSF